SSSIELLVFPGSRPRSQLLLQSQASSTAIYAGKPPVSVSCTPTSRAWCVVDRTLKVGSSAAPKVRPTRSRHPRPPQLPCTRRSPPRRTRDQRTSRSHSRCRLSLAPCHQRLPLPRTIGALRQGGARQSSSLCRSHRE